VKAIGVNISIQWHCPQHVADITQTQALIAATLWKINAIVPDVSSPNVGVVNSCTLESTEQYDMTKLILMCTF
jgi:hypothetical protein